MTTKKKAHPQGEYAGHIIDLHLRNLVKREIGLHGEIVPRRWEVCAICFDLTTVKADKSTRHPAEVPQNLDRAGVSMLPRIEIIETDSWLSQASRHAWDVETLYEAYWNRLNESSIDNQFSTHRYTDKVKVLWVRELV